MTVRGGLSGGHKTVCGGLNGYGGRNKMAFRGLFARAPRAGRRRAGAAGETVSALETLKEAMSFAVASLPPESRSPAPGRRAVDSPRARKAEGVGPGGAARIIREARVGQGRGPRHRGVLPGQGRGGAGGSRRRPGARPARIAPRPASRPVSFRGARRVAAARRPAPRLSRRVLPRNRYEVVTPCDL